MLFDSENFQNKEFKEICAKEGIEIRSLDVLDETNENKSAIDCTLSFPNNYNVDAFIDTLRETLSLRHSHEKH